MIKAKEKNILLDAKVRRKKLVAQPEKSGNGTKTSNKSISAKRDQQPEVTGPKANSSVIDKSSPETP